MVEETVVEEPQLDTQEASPETEVTPEEETQEVTEIQVPEDASADSEQNWTTDKRWDKYFKDPAGAYKSYRSMEEMHAPLKRQNDEYQSRIGELEASNTENQQVKQYLDYILGHEKYGPQAKELLSGINKDIYRSKYGYDLPEEVYSQLSQVDELKQRLDAKEQEELVGVNRQNINDSMGAIKDFADVNNIDYNELDFLDYCDKEEVPPNYMVSVFKEKAYDIALKNAESKGEDRVIKNLASQRKRPLGSTSKVAEPKSKEKTFGSEMNRILGIK